MCAIAFLFVRVLCDGFKSRRRLEAEILVLRHQLNVLQQRAPRRLYLTWADRCPYRKSNPHVLMVQPTKDRPHFDAPSALNEPSNWRILA
jgi:hypothetical protein